MKFYKYILIAIILLSQITVKGQKDKEYLAEGVVKDLTTKEKITSATLTFFGTDSSKTILQVDSLGHFSIKLNRNTSYAIIASAPGYLNAKVKKTGPHAPLASNYVFELEKIENCSGLIPIIVYDSNNSSNPYIPNEPNANPLEIIKRIMTDNPNLKVELIGYRDKNERLEVSIERSKNAIDSLVNLGIDRNRLLSKDGGTKTEITERKRNSDLNDTGLNHNRMLIFNIVDL